MANSGLQVAVPQCKLDGADIAMTVQRTLGDNGYATIAAGKWHVSPGGAALWDDYPAVIGLVNGTGFPHAAACGMLSLAPMRMGY